MSNIYLKKHLKKFEKKTFFMSGNRACAYGALFAGCNFFAGYPITPSTEIAETMAVELPKVNGYCVQMEDEIGSIAAVMGAVWAGAKAMTATSGPGFSLMQESIGYAIMTETPCVIVDVQRSGPSTGQATKPAQGDVLQARWGTHGDHNAIALSPNSAQECFELAIECFNLAEIYRQPVIFLMDGQIGFLRERVSFPKLADVKVIKRNKINRKNSKLIPQFVGIGCGKAIHITGSTHKDDGMRDVTTQAVHDRLIRRIYEKINSNRTKLAKVDARFCSDAKAVVISYGAPSRPALGAVLKARATNLKVGYIRLITLWPFPDETVKKLTSTADVIIMPEMNLGQLCREVERYVDCCVIPISKIGGVVHTVAEIYNTIKRYAK